MNMKNPLVAALLMTATAAFAQPYAANNFNNLTRPAGGMDYSAFPITDDGVYTCNSPTLPHIPFANCTSAQLEARAKWGGMCDRNNKACIDYIIRLGGNAATTIGNNVSCGLIPLRPCETGPRKPEPVEVEEIVVTAPRRAKPLTQAPIPGGDDSLPDDFIGPRLPPDAQPFKDDESFKAAIKTQQQATPNQKIIDLGDRRFALVSEDGQSASIGGLCAGNSCMGMEKPVANIPGLKAKIDAAAKGTAFSMTSQDNSKAVQNDDERKADAPNPDGSSRPTGARSLGNDIGGDIVTTGGGGSFSSTPVTGGEATGTTKAVPWTSEMRAQVLGATKLTYRNSQKVESIISEEAARTDAILQGGANQGRRGDPPGRAGTQAVANDGSAQ